jgi:hypothetical protein
MVTYAEEPFLGSLGLLRGFFFVRSVVRPPNFSMASLGPAQAQSLYALRTVNPLPTVIGTISWSFLKSDHNYAIRITRKVISFKSLPLTKLIRMVHILVSS